MIITPVPRGPPPKYMFVFSRVSDMDFFEIEMAQLELLDRVPVHRGVSCVVLASGTQNVTAVDYNRVREQWDSPRGVRSRTSAQGCILRCPCE